MNLFPQSFQSLERALSATALKQKVHAANIANVDTPNYKSKQVNFEAVLNEAAANQIMNSYKTNDKHIEFGGSTSSAKPRISTNHTTAFTQNGNNVDMDHEMAELAKNQLQYNALTERISGKFSTLSTVINGGR
ncbi:flagellar basal body rod protein FlgB [Planococcus glaciei]|uniref:flagellar basal body rod protein FlgB n=1 Tax=Planococcus glaciei TaxID=459472 RepID=UPI00069EA3E3|nr:flagellar basal body rod protein FlgB [Planococcus glaciei]KOF09899.1 flagellar basal body rod protein FlgB [Planococcus glaciei]